METLQNLKKATLIGLKVEIIRSTQKSLQGLSGKVIDETKNLIVIEIEKDNKKLEKKIAKIGCIFKFTIPGGDDKIEVNGNEIMFRPKDRPKKA